jgi:SEA domain
MKLELARNGKERLTFDPSLADPTSPNYSHLVALTHDSLDRMVMQSDLRDIYHGVHVTGFEGAGKAANGVLSNFYLQLSDNTDEKRLLDVFKKYLRANNYSLGGTELIAARPLVDLDVTGESFF